MGTLNNYSVLRQFFGFILKVFGVYTQELLKIELILRLVLKAK